MKISEEKAKDEQQPDLKALTEKVMEGPLRDYTGFKGPCGCTQEYCGYCRIYEGVLAALAEAVQGYVRERDEAQGELRMIDNVMARRPALDKPTRWENVEHAIATAAKADHWMRESQRMLDERVPVSHLDAAQEQAAKAEAALEEARAQLAETWDASAEVVATGYAEFEGKSHADVIRGLLKQSEEARAEIARLSKDVSELSGAVDDVIKDRDYFEQKEKQAEQREQALWDENARKGEALVEVDCFLRSVGVPESPDGLIARLMWLSGDRARLEVALQALRDDLREERRKAFRAGFMATTGDKGTTWVFEWPDATTLLDKAWPAYEGALLTAPAASGPVKTRCPYDQAQCEWSRCLDKDPHCRELNPQPAAPAGPQEQKCDCHLHPHQVCDICQGVTGKDADVTRWVVVVGKGSWSKCYGPFDSYDATMAWVRANQLDVEDVNVYPMNAVAATPGQEPKYE